MVRENLPGWRAERLTHGLLGFQRMEEDEAPRPRYILFLGAIAVVVRADFFAEIVWQA